MGATYEWPILLEQLGSPSVFSEVCATQSLVFSSCVVLCGPLFCICCPFKPLYVGLRFTISDYHLF
jgi:hypothetical protein